MIFDNINICLQNHCITNLEINNSFYYHFFFNFQYDENIDDHLLERPSSGSSSNCGSSNIIRQPRVLSGGAELVPSPSSIHQLSNTLKKSDLNVIITNNV